MKLTYRGICYDAAFNKLPTNAGVYALEIYRGVLMPFRSVVNIPKPLDVELKWRGIPYCIGKSSKQDNNADDQGMKGGVAGGSANVKASAAKPSLTQPTATAFKMSVLDQARNLFVRHHQKARLREQSMLVRLTEEVGLNAADSAHYETHIQGKIPHDFAGYDRSTASMS